MTARRSRWLLVVPLVLIAFPLTWPSTSWAGSTEQRLEDERARAGEIEARRAEALDELAGIRGDLAQLEAVLTEVTSDLEVAERAFETAEGSARGAAQELIRAEDELLAAEQRLEHHEELLASLARDTYKFGRSATSPQLAAFELLVASEDADALTDGLRYLERGLGAHTAAIEESAALREAVQQLAALAGQRAIEARREAEAADSARDEAATRHAQLDQLLAQMSAQLEQQAELLEELEREEAAAEAAIEAIEDQLERERAEERRREQERQAAAEAAARATGGAAPQGGLVQVRGITVAAALGPDLERLLADARADGIALGGSGWRSSEAQAALRRTNGCPDIYESPASSCRVPTARPGASEHEKGLAVDFTWKGRTICFPYRASACRGNPAFDWLQANASRYGLYVLPSEAWHWSTTGR